ncbi:hypothetical protein FQN60_012996 [Etheostoma spectabile]|uniref:Uncharacterized protein n=1 Tax=Etheostoma spectabile TaxID=54343 RepID=A0A5J5DCH1_9PERO|nr:hypothetical protein FQN60_012996 [Etheostoma spectabile]
MEKREKGGCGNEKKEKRKERSDWKKREATVGKDNEGQTALHYASACEFADIVELLLNAGADPSIKDMEGSLPEEVTESSAISSLLCNYTAPKG